MISTLILIVAIVGFFYLSGRINNLEHKVNQLKGDNRQQTAITPVSAVAPEESEVLTDNFIKPVEPVQSVPAPNFIPRVPEPALETKDNAFIKWISEDFFVKLGALLLLIAFGWFVSYAFANNWIGPMGRITFGLLAGVVFMVLGVWRIKTYIHQGGIFVVLGSTTILLTVFAARGIYEFFTPATALGIMFLSVVFVAFVSVRYRSQNLAIAGLLLGAVAPLLTNTDPNVTGMFSYLLVLVLGSLWVMYLLQTVVLPLLSFLVITFYGLPYLIGFLSKADSSIALLFAFIFTTVFFVSNVFSIVKNKNKNFREAHIFLAVGTGLYLTSWIAFAVDPVWQSLVDITWSLVFAMGAFLVYLRTEDKVPFYIYSAVSIGLIGVATAAEFNGAILTIAYTVEITALIFAAGIAFRDYNLLNRLSLLYTAPVILSMNHLIAPSWQSGFLHADFFAIAILMFCLWVSSIIIYGYRPPESIEADASTFLGVIGGLYAVALVWLVSHSVLFTDIATTISLFVYTVSGVTIFMLGQSSGKQVLRVSGGLLVGLVIARLLLVDVWAMDLVGRIVTFFVIGLLLISTAFLKKFRHSSHSNEVK